ncbi:putative dehydrogenase [Mucilaginibacter yixingensis]|uniref:Putative dehydrogenase n=1 Tax=Mucilaginibacter yixingensis TaxID=1295612 RepID=A0A2T5J7M5_9SPHI|nr:Gfo/Idh/MocA family oxidoreductase [Mucilaginibacter yixingensis]PTQ95144.1 putative dehydrogenase [Mucilaginibacter yixingensis]
MINWGIIGCGDVTEKKSGPAFSKVEGSKLVAVMRRDAEKAADYAQRHHVGRWYDDAHDLLADEDVNAIYIATPPSSHVDYAIDAIAAGLNVYVEKPVAMNAEEAVTLARVLAKSDVKLTVAHYRRAVPMFVKIKELLDAGTIGEVRTVQIRMWQKLQPQLVAKTGDNWRVDPNIAGGGYFHDLAPHQLDLMLHWFGEPVAYQGYGVNQSKAYAADDHVCGQIVFKNNVVVNGSWCFNVAESEVADSCEIIGTQGKITFPFFGNQLNWHNQDGAQNITFQHPEHIQQPMIEKIVAYFNGEGPNPCTIEEAALVMDMIDAFSQKVQ